MGRILTNRYDFLFERKGIKKPFTFIQDVYRSGKSREITSFIVWEIFHKLGLFPTKNYLNFINSDVITLNDVQLDSQEFQAQISQFFNHRGLTAIRSNFNWKLLFYSNGDIFGCLYPDDTTLYKSVDYGISIEQIYTFPHQIKAIYSSSKNTIFVSLKGSVYRSTDGGATFTKVLDFGSSVSFFRHNNGMTETPDNTLIIAEYGNVWENNSWRKLAYVYYSFDDGETWERSDFLISKGTNKHVHLVQYSKSLDKILLADGDNKKKFWISDSLDSSGEKFPNWNLVNTFHIQMGGYTSIVEYDGTIVLGTDYQGGTNFVVETTDGKKFTKRIIPDPYRRSPIDNMVLRQSNGGSEVWANLPFSTAKSKCLLMYSSNSSQVWNKVVEYDRSQHKIWLISSSKNNVNELYFSIETKNQTERVVYKVVDQGVNAAGENL